LVTVGYTELHDLTSSELALLPNEESDREFASDKRRREFLCARSLLRRMLQDRTGTPGANHLLTISKDGKPECVNGPAISITHAGDHVACCIADDGTIGIDLEVVAERRDPKKLANKFFSREESGWLSSQPVDRFFMLWVLKEAYVKAIGRSIFGGINRLRCRVLPPDIDVLSVSDHMRNLCLFGADEVFLALATTKDSLADVAISRWDFGADKFVMNNKFNLLAASGELEA
jgi:phosphopantetheine--protein transferase-like protein